MYEFSHHKNTKKLDSFGYKAVSKREADKREKPHLAASRFGASFCLLASRAHIPVL
jgi:hypothetical protein